MIAPWKESYDKLGQHIRKQRHCFANKVHLVKTMVFPIVLYGYESWTIKKTECHKIDAFELWIFESCWSRLLKVTWIARRSNLTILKEINLEYSLERLMLAEGEAPIVRSPDAESTYWKCPDPGKDWGQKEKEGAQRMTWLASTNSMDMNLSQLWKIVEDRGAWPAAVHRVTKSWTQFSDWTRTITGKVDLCSLLHQMYKSPTVSLGSFNTKSNTERMPTFKSRQCRCRLHS